MRIFMVTDLEGVAGVMAEGQLSDISNPFYRQARAWQAGEINAAVAGAREAGAGDIVIYDGHGGGFDMALFVDQIEDSGVRFLYGEQTQPMELFAQTRFDAILMIGQHPRKGATGVLEHTWANCVVMRTVLNEVEVGEIGLWAAAAGGYGVPLACVTGDEVAAREMEPLAAGVVGVPVKQALARTSGVTLHPAEARARIHAGVTTALRNLPNIGIWQPAPPYHLRVEYSSDAFAAKYRPLPFVEYAGDCAIILHAETLPELFARWYFLNRVL